MLTNQPFRKMGKFAQAAKKARRNVWKKAGKTARKKMIQRKRTVKNISMAKVGKGFPKKMMMTHKYNDVIAITCNTGATATYNFTANGMYDPDVTSTGHQPMYFDQMGALYDHYTVIGSKVKVSLTPTSATQQACVFGVYKNDDATVTPANISSLMEQSEATYKVVSFNSALPTSFSKKWSAKKTFGGSIMANTNLFGFVNTNPAELQVYTFYLKPVDGVSTVTCYFTVEIEYIAVWSELKDIAGS